MLCITQEANMDASTAHASRLGELALLAVEPPAFILVLSRLELEVRDVLELFRQAIRKIRGA